MPFTHYQSTKRLAAVVLGFGLMIGCSEQPGADPNVGTSARASSDANAAVEQREAQFSVPDMDCPMCPITVKRALSNVDGVFAAEADLKTKQAQVVFDPLRTDTGALIAAIESSGFSAHLKENDHE